MSVEFLFVSHGVDAKFLEINSSYSVEYLSSGILLFKNSESVSVCRTKEMDAWLIGEVYNIDALRLILGQLEGKAWTLNEAEVLLQLKAHLGNRALSLAEGDFCLFMQQPNKELVVNTDPQGLNLISVVKAEQLWITNCLKLIGRIAGAETFQFLSAAIVSNSAFKADDFSPLSNALRLKPGSINLIARDSQFYPCFESQLLNMVTEPHELKMKQAKLLNHDRPWVA